MQSMYNHCLYNGIYGHMQQNWGAFQCVEHIHREGDTGMSLLTRDSTNPSLKSKFEMHHRWPAHSLGVW